MEQSGSGNAYDILTTEAANIQPGSEGRVFLPYLSGERTPYPDPHARGAFVGLTLRHGKAYDKSRIGGVSYGLKDCSFNAGTRVNPATVVLSGVEQGLPFGNKCWQIFETSCCLVNATEGAAYGAALCNCWV